jgi:hypothetical protein
MPSQIFAIGPVTYPGEFLASAARAIAQGVRVVIEYDAVA